MNNDLLKEFEWINVNCLNIVMWIKLFVAGSKLFRELAMTGGRLSLHGLDAVALDQLA